MSMAQFWFECNLEGLSGCLFCQVLCDTLIRKCKRTLETRLGQGKGDLYPSTASSITEGKGDLGP